MISFFEAGKRQLPIRRSMFPRAPRYVRIKEAGAPAGNLSA
jgi:hypothetical protein